MKAIMKKLINAKRLVLFALTFLTCGNLAAKQYPTVTGKLQTIGATTVTIGTSSATNSIEVVPVGGTKDYHILNTVALKFDLHADTFFASPAQVRVKVSIDRWDETGTPLSTRTEYLKVSADNRTANVVLQQSLVKLPDGYKVEMTIDSIWVNNDPKETLPRYVWVESEINMDRYYDFSSSGSTAVDSYTLIPLDNDCDDVNEELSVVWTPNVMAEEYQLEWTFVNNYSSDGTATYPASAFTADFKHNSTRVTVYDNSYNISLLYDKGYLAFRVRGVGRNYLNPSEYIYGPWSTSAIGGDVVDLSDLTDLVNLYEVADEHEGNKNWQYSSTFAEEGKKKEVINYFDGSLHNRQSVTKTNSNELVIVGETIYDFQGRPAVNILPVPVVNTCMDPGSAPSIKYYSKFNVDDTNHVYSKNDFDLDAASCGVATAPMDTVSGASRYYSTNNPDKTNQQAFLPHAKEYPFTQTEFTPDNTGRIRSQSGVGKDYRMGSGKETTYLYGQPNQVQVDRLFGSEAGDASHYKKNVVIDANGQASVTYLNQEGKTIATSLAGLAPTEPGGASKMDSLEYANANQKFFSVDLFNKDANGQSKLNKIPSSNDRIEFSTQLLVSYKSLYEFNYNLEIDTLADPCLKEDICVNCIYNLDVKVTDVCGYDLAAAELGSPAHKVVGKVDTTGGVLTFSVHCTDPTLVKDSVKFDLLLEPGAYTVSKILTINEDARKFYVQKYLDTTYNSCVKSLSYFKAAELAKIDTMECYNSCSACAAALGSKDDFVSSGKGTDVQYEYLLEQCLEPCRQQTLCKVTYDMMLSDVSIGGQYGKYNPSTFYADDQPVSVFNIHNYLSANVGGRTGNWKQPRMRINGVFHNLYLDRDGERTKVYVTADIANYVPPVDNTSLVYTDTLTSQQYTYPENLTNLSDFVSVWSPGFAKSLVVYHPEYAYYVSCSEQAVVFPDDSYSSDYLDSLMFATNTFSTAVTNGFIDALTYTNTGTPALDKLTAIWSSTVALHDPFFTNTSFIYGNSANSITGTSTSLSMLTGFGALRVDPKNEMTYKINHYKTYNGVDYTMAEVAALLARCGNHFGAPPTAACIAFGTDFFPSPTSQEVIWNDSIRNREWQFFKNFYYSEKQKLQYRRMEFYAKMHNNSGSDYFGGSNCCMGTSSYDPVASHMLFYTGPGYLPAVSRFYDPSQPCSAYSFGLYSGTTKRFYDPANSGLSTDNVAQQLYETTGQCPLAFQLQNFLNGMAQTRRLASATATRLDTVYEFNPDLYTALNGGLNPSVYVNYTWTVTSTTGTVLTVHLIDTAAVNRCTLTIDASGTGITRVDSIRSISQLLYDPTGVGAGAFKAVATYYSGGILHSANIKGNSCFNVKDCSFDPVCKPNQFALDMQVLLSILQVNGILLTATVTPHNLSRDTITTNFLTPAIKTTLGTPNTKIMYKVLSANKIAFYDSLNSPTKIRLSFLTITPSGTGSNIKGFANINSQGNNLFTMQGVDSLGNVIANILAKADKITAGDTVGISMGNCGLPEPAVCQQKEHLVRKDLEAAVKEILTQKPFNSNINAVGFSNLLKSYALDSLLSTVYLSDTTVSNYDTLLIFNSDSLSYCHFMLTHSRTNGSKNNFNEIVNVTDLQGIGNADIAGNYYDFMAIATYTTNTGFAKDTIYGTSCWPIKNCDACLLPEDTLDMYNGGFYEEYAGSGTLFFPDPHPTDCNYTTVYEAINNITSIFNSSAYSTTHSYTLTPVTYSLAYLYCKCYKTYIDYVNIYINADAASIASLPLPANITNFTGCNDGSYCSDMYARYLKALKDYNVAMNGTGVPTIGTLYSQAEFNTKYCHCAKKFINNLYGIIAGSVPPTLPNITNLDSACVRPPCTSTIDSTISVPTFTTYTNPCVLQMKNLAAINAANAYNQYIDSITTDFADRYNRHCLGAMENFNYRYVDKEYHFTLYYYDQAGNLVKTIPPEGIDPLDITASTDALAKKINNDRTNNQHTVFTTHRMPTKYVYNSLNQLTYQAMPDHDNMDLCDGNNPNGLDTSLIVTSVQFVNSNKGYLTGFIILNSTHNRGYLYTTNDGGANWTKVSGLAATDLQKIQFNSDVYQYIGFAISTNGLILKTIDGGGNWDLVTSLYTPLSGSRYTGKLTAMYMDPDTGIVAGINDGTNAFMYYTNDSAKTFAPCVVTGSVAGDTITSISYADTAGVMFIASARNGLSGKLFKSTDRVNWTPIISFTANNYKKVQYTSASLIIVAGEDGNLFKTASTVTVQQIPTGVSQNIIDVYFKNEKYGVALIDSVPGKARVWKTMNGGTSWEPFTAPGEYYTSLKSYDSTKVIAVGEDGLISKLIMTIPPFGIIKTQAPNGDDYSCSDAVRLSGGGLLSVVASASTHSVHIAYNTQNSAVSWLTKNVSTLASPIPSSHATFKKILVSVTSTVTPTINALLLSTTGRLYSLSRTYNSSTVTCDTVRITGSLSGKFFGDITTNSQSGTVKFYAYDTIAKVLHRIDFTGSVATGTALANSSPITGHVNSIDIIDAGNGILLTGDNGYILRGANVSLATVVWTNFSNVMKPCALNDVQLFRSSAMAVGDDGNIWSTSSGYNDWYLRKSGTAAHLTALDISDSVGTDGLIVGTGGKMIHISKADSAYPIFANISSPTTGDYTDVALSRGGITFFGNLFPAYATAANGKVVYIPDYRTPVPVLAASPSTSRINSVTFVGQYADAYVAGAGNSIYRYAALSSFKVKNIYIPPIPSAHFFDANNGYVVDTCHVVRRTTDGGLNWSVVLAPTGSRYISAIHSTKANQAVIVGRNKLAIVVNDNTISNITVPSLTGTVNFLDVNFNAAKNYGVIVGNATRALELVPNGNNFTMTNLGQAGYSANFKTVHVFDNKSFIAAGAKGRIYYYKGGTFTAQQAYTAPASLAQTDLTFNDIFFHDDYTGYVVGRNGAAFKVNLEDTIGVTGTSANAMPWNTFCSQALNMNYIGDSMIRKMNYTSIAFSSRTKGMIAGYDSNVVVYPGYPVTPNRYARLIKEESGYYSSRFFYDKLGRMVLSQNTKQFNKSNPDSAEVKQAFSYTLYDALGRIAEVGEKFENLDSAGLRFNNIFGTAIGSYYNINAIDDTKFNNWVTGNGSRREVTKTYYDEQKVFSDTIAIQQNLRKRVASVTYEDIYDGYDSTYQHATHYSYDIHGNVNTLWQENPSVLSVAQNMKRMDYDYDLISGKVNNVHYQNGQADAFHHHYEYDADNRITQVYTSNDLDARWTGEQDDPLWTADAKYFYYDHGPLARVEYGKDHVQGVDYAYTIQGWIKGVNSNLLNPNKDMGNDGKTGHVNEDFARDVFGYTLNYYKGDYMPVDVVKWNAASTRFEAFHNSSDMMSNRNDLFNGNISSMVTTISKADTGKVDLASYPLGNAYRYDQLNRITRSSSYNNFDLDSNKLKNNGASIAGLYRNTFSYDANGNIKTQMKYDSLGFIMDSLVYKYETINAKLRRNRLYHVNEKAGSTTMSYDIEDQGTFAASLDSMNMYNNYRYDEIGNLVGDSLEGIDTIRWTVYGKIKAIKRFSGSGRDNLYFDYDASGNRVAKHLYTSADVWKSSMYYVRDAQGNVLSTYKHKPVGMDMSYKLQEQHLYGSNRLGMVSPDLEMIDAITNFDTVRTYLGHKSYEMSNHLGNVLSVVSDKKSQVEDTTTATQLGHYIAGLTYATDYYPFGQILPGRAYDTPNCYTDTTLVLDTVYYNDGTDLEGWLSFGSISSSHGEIILGSTFLFSFSGPLMEASKTYTLSFDLDSDCEGFDIEIDWKTDDDGGILASSTYTSSGTYTYTFTTPPTVSNLYFSISTGGCSYTFDNITLTTMAEQYHIVCDDSGPAGNKGNYRYGFNGKEYDIESIATDHGTQDYGMRIYNPALGRFLSADPIATQYPKLSPYQFASNTPIQALDIDGLEAWEVKNQWNTKYIKQYEIFAKKYTELLKGQDRKFTCEDLSLYTASMFAMVNKLPFKFSTEAKEFDASSKDYTDFATFQNDLLTNSAANDLANDKNTTKVTFNEAKQGDVIVIFAKGKNEKATHVQVVTEVNLDEKYVKTMQGNTSASVGRKARLANWLSGKDPANPKDKSYFGVDLVETFWETKQDIYFQIGTKEMPHVDWSKTDNPEFRKFNFVKMNSNEK